MKYLLSVVALLSAESVYASNFTGSIEKLIIGREGHQVFVHIKDAPQTCGKDHSLGFNYAFSLRDHEAGKEILSALLASQLSGEKVTIQGDNTCSLSSEVENIGYIYTY